MHKLLINKTAPVGITLGEPNGIGPDIMLMLAAIHSFRQPLVVITDPELLRQRAERLGLAVMIQEVSETELLTLPPSPLATLCVLPIALPSIATHHTPGILQPANASWVLQTIEKATLLCAAGKLAAMVTGPVQKSVINDAGIAFSGHTEYIAQTLSNALAQPVEPLMMLTSGAMLPHPLRVALATTHHALKDVPQLIHFDLIFEKIKSLHTFMQSFYGLTNPRLLVAGLNPHAGEQGHLGMEELDIIKPAIAKAQANTINVVGPLPADTLFTPQRLEHADAVLAMYHDQGLPVLKYASFGGGINVTLGLPIIRTSVDHGTALDLAGTLKANTSSLKAALDEAFFILSRV